MVIEERDSEELEAILGGARNEIYYLTTVLPNRRSTLTPQDRNAIANRIRQVQAVATATGISVETPDEIAKIVTDQAQKLNPNRGWLRGSGNNANSRLT